MRTAAMKQRAHLAPADTDVILTPQLMEQYLNALKAGGRKAQTIRSYRRSVEELYEYLPKEKEITEETLEDWKTYLRDFGYSDSTINLRLVATNGLLRYCGAEEMLASHGRIEAIDKLPELTREEYLHFLSVVRDLGAEREYYLIKVFGCIDIKIGELDALTVETCRQEVIHMPDGRESAMPHCLCEELLEYAASRGIEEGMVFATRTGAPLDRSNITNAIHRLAKEAGMEPEKCTPRALQRMYQTTRAKLLDQLRPFYCQSLDNMLRMEQSLVKWQA